MTITIKNDNDNENNAKNNNDDHTIKTSAYDFLTVSYGTSH